MIKTTKTDCTIICTEDKRQDIIHNIVNDYYYHDFNVECYSCIVLVFQGVNICRYLWCYVGGMRCETKFLPAAEGTPCDENKVSGATV